MKNHKLIDQESNGIKRRGFIAKTLFAAAGSLALVPIAVLTQSNTGDAVKQQSSNSSAEQETYYFL